MDSNRKPVVFDIDDLCDIWDPWDELMAWKERNPNGKVTAFLIPGRSSDELIEKYRALDWVELAMHGWWHTRGECLWWTEDHAARLLGIWEDAGLPKVFKAPAWLCNEQVINVINERGWKMASHIEDPIVPDGAYVYNLCGTPEVRFHGHTHDTCNNGPKDWGFFGAHKDRQFLFVSEVP